MKLMAYSKYRFVSYVDDFLNLYKKKTYKSMLPGPTTRNIVLPPVSRERISETATGSRLQAGRERPGGDGRSARRGWRGPRRRVRAKKNVDDRPCFSVMSNTRCHQAHLLRGALLLLSPRPQSARR